MQLKIAEYNLEWMKDLFEDGIPINVPADAPLPEGVEEKVWKKKKMATVRSQSLIKVLAHLNADIIAVVEGPNTLKDGSLTATGQLERWMETFGLQEQLAAARNYKAIEGFPSPGQQELCAIYDADRFILEHSPEGENRFDEPFTARTLEINIKEQYEHYRPPLELTVKNKQNQEKLFKMIVAHAKSKGIFDHVDYIRYERLSELNRRKLYAECGHIRERVDKWLIEGDKVIVLGDINDGMGSDFYENRLGRDAVEVLLGSVYEPERILKSAIGKPKLGKYGWTPNSSTFTDTITSNWFTVLIDYILLSQNVALLHSGILNPYLNPLKEQEGAEELREALKTGSDHFPVYATIDV